jgi:hypothetical protein
MGWLEVEVHTLYQKKNVFIFVCFGLIPYPTFNLKMRSCLYKDGNTT